MTQIQTMKKSNRITTKELVLTAMFTAIICVLSQIQIPTQPIPFTLGLFAILLTGAFLTPRNALLAVLVYLLLGAVGAPVFAGFKGGVGALFDKTGGFLMAYPLMAFIISMSYHYIKRYKMIALTAGMLVALVLCYLLGSLWFSLIQHISFYLTLTYCVFPFVVFDLLKITLALSISFTIRRTIMRNIIL